MATRNALSIMRSARAGHAPAQLALGQRYLFGDQGLPRNPASALYWLDRAASQQEPDAWLLIGRHVPFEVARSLQPLTCLAQWYERAYDSGVHQAGLVFAQLVLGQPDMPVDANLQRRALGALRCAAEAGIAEAQWYLAQKISGNGDLSSLDDEAAMAWVYRAAQGGITDARRTLRERAWAEGDKEEYIFWALPEARECLVRCTSHKPSDQVLNTEDRTQLSRCARLLLQKDSTSAEGFKMLKLAAQENDQEAQFFLGLQFARLDENGARCAHTQGTAQYKKAIYWLTQAAQQAHAKAWFVLACLYRKRACSLRDGSQAQYCLQRAAQGGHAQAQYEIGVLTWRRRSVVDEADVEASRWLLQAAHQDHTAAQLLLKEMDSQRRATHWLPANLGAQLMAQLNNPSGGHTEIDCPFLAARLVLAQAFGLSMAEALMIDPIQADRTHCLCVDIRAQRPRAPRRLIMINHAAQRRALEQCQRIFTAPKNGMAHAEGSYRQRAYRLRAHLKKKVSALKFCV